MRLKAILDIQFSDEKNRAGQYPLQINIISEDDKNVLLGVLGMRYASGSVLDTFGQVGSKVFYHSRTNPELALAIKDEYFRLKKEGYFSQKEET